MGRIPLGSQSDTTRQSADEVVNANYRRLQRPVEDRVRATLAAQKIEVAQTDLEEAYVLAWQAVCLMIERGTRIENLTGLVVQATRRRAIDLYREQRSGRRVDVEMADIGVEEDWDSLLDDQSKLERLLRLIRSELKERECKAFVLTMIHGYTRAEVADMLGLRRAQIEKLMDRATRKVGRIVAMIDARGCGDSEWSEMIRAYALGAIGTGEPDHARVEAHLQECGACHRYVNLLQALDAVMPPPILWVLPGAAAAAHAGGILAALRSAFDHAEAPGGPSELLHAARRIGTGWSPLTGWGAGVAAKGVAVIAVAGATTAGIAVGTSAHHASPKPARTTVEASRHTILQPASSNAAEPAGTGEHRRRAPHHARAASRTHHHRHVGAHRSIRTHSQSTTTTATAPAAEPIRTTRSSTPSSTGSQVSAIEEFGIERR